MSTSVDGSDEPRQIAGYRAAPRAVEVTSDCMFWMNTEPVNADITDSGAHNISRIDIGASGEPESAVAGEAEPWALDVNDTYLYSTTREGDEIRRTIK